MIIIKTNIFDFPSIFWVLIIGYPVFNPVKEIGDKGGGGSSIIASGVKLVLGDEGVLPSLSKKFGCESEKRIKGIWKSV